MPHRKKKPFIEKKKAVSFHLVHRSQRDPLAADETAPQRVLLPAQKINDEERRAEQRKYGVFFDDDYDYLQHLKEASGPSELIPTSTSRAHSRRDAKEDTLVIPVSFFCNFKALELSCLHRCLHQSLRKTLDC